MRLNCTMSPVMNSGATQQRPSRRVIMQVVAEDILQDICNRDADNRRLENKDPQ